MNAFLQVCGCIAYVHPARMCISDSVPISTFYMYVCMYVRIHKHTHAHTHTHTYVYSREGWRWGVHTHACVCVCVCIWFRAHILIHFPTSPVLLFLACPPPVSLAHSSSLSCSACTDRGVCAGVGGGARALPPSFPPALPLALAFSLSLFLSFAQEQTVRTTPSRID
jgi:hypothetical protein